MTKTKKSDKLVRRLKKQVVVFRQKEKSATQELKKAFSKIEVLGKVYEKKATVALKKMKAKLNSAKPGTYLKTAGAIERKVEKKVAEKQKVLGRVLFDLAKSLEQKAKRLM